jgi:hypothetical protein
VRITRGVLALTSAHLVELSFFRVSLIHFKLLTVSQVLKPLPESFKLFLLGALISMRNMDFAVRLDLSLNFFLRGVHALDKVVQCLA